MPGGDSLLLDDAETCKPHIFHRFTDAEQCRAVGYLCQDVIGHVDQCALGTREAATDSQRTLGGVGAG